MVSTLLLYLSSEKLVSSLLLFTNATFVPLRRGGEELVAVPQLDEPPGALRGLRPRPVRAPPRVSHASVADGDVGCGNSSGAAGHAVSHAGRQVELALFTSPRYYCASTHG